MKVPFRFAAALLTLLVSTAALAAPEWPATEPGRHAREYFPAYNGGEQTMRAFFLAHLDAASLKERPVEMRLDVWHRIQDENGALTPLKVTAAGEDYVTVLAKNATGGSLSITFQCASAMPHGLLALRIEQGDGDEEVGGAPAAVAGPAAPAAPAGPPPSDREITAALVAEVDSLAKADQFSGVVLLDKAGTPLWSGARGMAQRGKKQPNGMDTRFNLGSINKIFTTVAIHQLAEAGKLSLDDPVARWLPDYPAEAAKKITIQMLLDHRSGVPDFFRSPKLEEHPERIRTAEDWYAIVREMPLDFEPGTKERYSNGGYAMLGRIVERASGEDYYAYVRKHVFAPAGMVHTDSYTLEERKGDFAVGYSHHPDRLLASAAAPGAWIESPQPFGRGSSAGGGYSTAGDLLRFAAALRAGKLLGPEGTRRFAGGLGIAGGAPGVNALLEITGPYTLVVLSNLDPPSAERFSRSIGRMLRRANGEAGDRTERTIRAGG